MKLPPGFTISKTPSMLAGWIPWKWIGVRMLAGVPKVDAEKVVLGHPDDRAGAVPLYVHAG